MKKKVLFFTTTALCLMSALYATVTQKPHPNLHVPVQQANLNKINKMVKYAQDTATRALQDNRIRPASDFKKYIESNNISMKDVDFNKNMLEPYGYIISYDKVREIDGNSTTKNLSITWKQNKHFGQKNGGHVEGISRKDDEPAMVLTKERNVPAEDSSTVSSGHIKNTLIPTDSISTKGISKPTNNGCSCSKQEVSDQNDVKVSSVVDAINKLTDSVNELVKVQSSCGACSSSQGGPVPNDYLSYKDEIKQKEEASQKKFDAETDFLNKQREERLREAREIGEGNKKHREKLQTDLEAKANDLPKDYSKSGSATSKVSQAGASYPASHTRGANFK